MVPVKVQQSSSSELRIEWDDGHKSRYSLTSLRDNCPCASCRGDREIPQVMLPILVPGKYELRGIDPVGSYALLVSWGDGHRTGIYTYEYLRLLCQCDLCVGATIKR